MKKSKFYIFYSFYFLTFIFGFLFLWSYSNENKNREIIEDNSAIIESYEKDLDSIHSEFKNMINENDDLKREKYELDNQLILSSDYIETLEDELTSLRNDLSVLTSPKYSLKYFGDCDITYYCDERYEHICGGNGKTASGNETEVGWTIATDWNVFPCGTILYIEGIGFREVQDVGGAVNGNHIDVLVETHQEAIDNGTCTRNVWVLIKEN